MIEGFSFDVLHLLLGLIAAGLTGFYLLEHTSSSRLRRRLLEVEEEVVRLRAAGKAPEVREYRVERFDVLWFPQVSYRSASKEVLAVGPGVPHCKACVEPLKSSGGRSEWACSRCGASFAESIVDLSSMDIVAGEALKWFLERFKGFRPPPKN